MATRILGVTGTRQGMTTLQYESMDQVLRALRNKYDTMHQGCCLGADEQMTLIGVIHNYRIIGHPPTLNTWISRVACDCSDELLTRKKYDERNRAIVDAANILLAAPKTEKEDVRSGTWSTVRYARKLKMQIILVYPDGRIDTEVNL